MMLRLGRLAMTAEPIPKAELKAARRKLSRRIAAVIITAMAETDTSFALMAVRLGTTEGTMRRQLNRMLDGKDANLDTISDMLFACGCELDFQFSKLPPPSPGNPGSGETHG